MPRLSQFKLRSRSRSPLLLGLNLLVVITVLTRPSALLTFGFIALAGILTSGKQSPPDSP